MAKNRFFEDEKVEHRFQMQHLKRLVQYVKPYSATFVLTLLLVLVTSALSIIAPYLTKILVDDIIPQKNISGVLLVVLIFMGSISIQIIMTIRRVLMMTKAGHQIIFDIRRDVFANLQRLSFDYFDSRPTGKILIRLTTYINSMANLLSDGIINALANLLTLFAIIAVMLSINLKLTLVSIVTCLPLIAFVAIFRKTMQKWWRRVSNTNANREAFIHENIMGVKVTQAFLNEKENQDTYDELNNQCIRAWISTVIRNNLFWPGVDILGTIGFAATFVVGIRLLEQGEVTIGTVIAFSTYIGRFWAPINDITAVINQFFTSMANAERIFEVIDEKPDIQDREDAIELQSIKGEVIFKDVSFSYEAETPILKHVNFHVYPGETIALVGPTGAGKTTIVNLLARFYDVSDGCVMLDGIDIRQIKQHFFRSQMGIMMQDSFIFMGTIAENIRYGKQEASDSEVIKAAKAVHADQWIQKLPHGYNSYVEERGANLSTGERQLLSFARLVLSDPKVMILDEATSSIDTKTDMLIQIALGEMTKGRTSFIIAHRLSTIKKADRIFYIDDGTILEEGNHEQLMEQKGKYYKLYKSQKQ